MMLLYIVILIVFLSSSCYSFHITTNLKRYTVSTSTSYMRIDAMRDIFGLVPLCDANPFSSAPPSVSIVDDPTAGDVTKQELPLFLLSPISSTSRSLSLILKP